MMAFDLLSEPIRRYIRDKRWEELRPIQKAAIEKILSTNDNYILASKTASGKTEAAFLPILSKVDFKQTGVQVLYISPLIALINDQFQRVEELCKYMDVTVTKWHGEASKSLKDKLVKNPSGIVLITPESIEAMFVNHPYQVKALFSNLKFIVIDEIHSFIGSDRGLQLKSLLWRIKQTNETGVRTIGLSATIGKINYAPAKAFFEEKEKTTILNDITHRELASKFKYTDAGNDEYPVAFIENLYEETKEKKVLIFPNSRGKAEEIAVKLKKIAERKNGHQYYFSHHSSVDKEVREYVEQFAKSNDGYFFCIVCTSTLELGIDIGSVDMVVQIDATFSIASLVQRVGRSGRREGTKSNLLLYATEHWQLLQSIACWQLYKEDKIEPFSAQSQPFDLLFHQILSVLKETSGCSRNDLITMMRLNAAFVHIAVEEIALLVGYMIEADYVEDLKNELIIGYAGERLTNTREFYAVFETLPAFKVMHNGNTVGELPFSPMIIVDRNILLAAKIWKIKDVDIPAKKILVVPASDGKKPLFFGNGGDIHQLIRQKMFQILRCPLVSNDTYEESVVNAIGEVSLLFEAFDIVDAQYDRPVIVKDKSIEFYTFSGSRVNKTLSFLFTCAGIKHVLHDAESMMDINGENVDVTDLLKDASREILNIDKYIVAYIATNPAMFNLTKWGKYLPDDLKMRYVKDSVFDVAGTMDFLGNVNIVKATNN